MNKKFIVFSVGLLLSANVFGQKKILNQAKSDLDNAQKAAMLQQDDNAAAAYTKAKDEINQAVAHPDTKDNADAWLTKAGIYIGMQANPKLNADNPYKEGVAALNKALELNPKLSTDETFINLTIRAADGAYRAAIDPYNTAHYSEAFDHFKQAKTLLGEDGDSRFKSMPDIDTVRANAVKYMGFSAFRSMNETGANADERLEEAIKDLNKAKNSPYLQGESDVYIALAQAYEKKGDKANQNATITEGLKKFPNDNNLRGLDINLTIETGSKDQAIQKMEEAIAKNPTNPDLYMNLGILNYNVGYPKDGTTNPKADEYGAKAETAYKKAIELAPDNATYNFQLGSMYFNQAALITKQMNALGMSKDDQAKYTQLEKKMNEAFAKATPYLEKTKEIYYPKKGSLSKEQMTEYINCLTGLKEIYARSEQMDKKAEITKLLKEVTE